MSLCHICLCVCMLHFRNSLIMATKTTSTLTKRTSVGMTFGLCMYAQFLAFVKEYSCNKLDLVGQHLSPHFSCGALSCKKRKWNSYFKFKSTLNPLRYTYQHYSATMTKSTTINVFSNTPSATPAGDRQL